MADPVTALLVVSAVTGTASAGISVHGAREQGKSAKEAAEFKATQARKKAKAIRAKGRFEQKRQAEQAERVKGAQRVAGAATGGRGQAVTLALAEQALELERDNVLIGFSATKTANELEVQGDLESFAGSQSLYASRIKATGSLLQGISSVAMMGAGLGKGGGGETGGPGFSEFKNGASFRVKPAGPIGA